MNATGSPQLNYIAIHKTSVWEACDIRRALNKQKRVEWNSVQYSSVVIEVQLFLSS
jgi:hypothetical protein